jgi:hypothetical protein
VWPSWLSRCTRAGLATVIWPITKKVAVTPGRPPRPPPAAATPSWPPTPAPSARCATTARWAAGYAPTPGAGWSSTPPSPAPKRGWTANTCWSPPTPITSDPDLPAEDVALGYKNLLEAERGFRGLKSTLELRPVFNRLELRIRAHVLLCWLALLLIRVAERRTGQTWPALARELDRLHAVTLTGPTGTLTQTTELTTAQQGILRACGVTARHDPGKVLLDLAVSLAVGGDCLADLA